MINTDLTRRGWFKTATSHAIAAAVSLQFACSIWAEEPVAGRPAIRGEIVLPRAGHDWMSQQIEEPCILPNPKVPGRLIMFYSAVSSSNRVVAAIGKAWADTRDPFRWHQDDANPIFRPAGRGWDSVHHPPRHGPLRARGGRLLHLLLRLAPARFRTGSVWRSVRRARTATPA